MPSARAGRRSVYLVAAEVCTLALVVFAPLALGSAPAWTLWPIVLGGALASVLALIGCLRERNPVHLPLLALVPALIAGLCLLQLVPLPAALLRLLSPPAAEVREFALEPLGLAGPRPISLAPRDTWREVAKHLAYLSLLLAAVQIARS